MKVGRRCNYHKGRAAIRHYANLREPSDSLRFKLYCEAFTSASPQSNMCTPSGIGGQRVCTVCGIVILKKNFPRHFRDKHTGPKPRSLCPLCQKSYKTPDWLKDSA